MNYAVSGTNPIGCRSKEDFVALADVKPSMQITVELLLPLVITIIIQYVDM